MGLMVLPFEILFYLSFTSQIRQMVTLPRIHTWENCPSALSISLLYYASFVCPICQVVLLSGHLDSWDVGQGAMDDGGGAMISWEALSLIKDLGDVQ